MNVKSYFVLLLVLGATLLSGCGFQLRGKGTELTNIKVYLETANDNAKFERSLKRQLTYQGAELVKEKQQAQAILVIGDYFTEKRTVARDSLGRASELELIFNVHYLLSSSKDKAQPSPKKMISRREFAYERNLQAGQENEQSRLESDMHQEIIGRLLLQLAQVDRR